MAAPTLLLVHGAWHGAWAWTPVVERLESAGIEVVTVDLSSSGPDAETLGGLADDVAVIDETAAGIEGDVVLVGHSYGGIPITQASIDNVVHLVYVAAFMLDEGESLLGALGGEVPDWIELVADGAASRANRPHEIFYADVDAELADEAAARLGLQSVPSFAAELTHAAWRHLPSTYLLTEQDRAIPPPAQEAMSARADTVHRLATSHSPFLSQPDAVVAHLTDVLATHG